VNWSIRNKLFLLGGLGTSLVLGLGMVLWNALGTSNTAVADLARANTALRNQMEGDMHHDALRGDVFWAVLADKPAEVEEASAALEEHGADFLSLVGGNLKIDLPRDLHDDTEKLIPLIRTYVEVGRNVVAQARTDHEAAHRRLPEFERAFGDLQTAMDSVSDRIQQNAEATQKHATADLASVSSMGLSGVILAILVMLGGGYLVARSVLVPLDALRARVVALGSGECDLRQRLEAGRTDELGQVASGFNTFLARLQSMVGKLGSNANALLSAARSLLSTSGELASGAEHTRQQSGQVAAAAEEMSATLQEVSNNGQQTTNRISTVAEAVSQIGVNVAEVARSAQDASAVSGQAATLANSSNTLIGELGTAAEEIGRVINTIQDIADQTNLLALNATIEAARAGEAGRGFAVVANEVKALAGQTSEATTDIRQRIERIQTGTQQTVGRMGEIVGVIARVSEASQIIARQVGEQRGSMQSITENVAEVARMMSMLNTGVRESAKVSTEISRSIGEVDATAQRSSKGAGSTRAAGQEVETLASNLQGLLGQFQV
jgi:methyl-accepting chemotaxis protein